MNSLILILKKYFYAAALTTGCCFVCGCENDPKQIEALTKNVIMVEEGKNIEGFLSQDGTVKAKLISPVMLRVLSDSEYVEFPKTLHVDFYDDSAKVQTWLDSRYGKYYEKQGKVYLRDSVIVINIKGDTLKAPDLWWDQNAKLFYTDKYAEYHAKGKNIYGGKGLEATQDMNSVTFKEPTGIVLVSKEGGLQ